MNRLIQKSSDSFASMVIIVTIAGILLLSALSFLQSTPLELSERWMATSEPPQDVKYLIEIGDVTDRAIALYTENVELKLEVKKLKDHNNRLFNDLLTKDREIEQFRCDLEQCTPNTITD